MGEYRSLSKQLFNHLKQDNMISLNQRLELDDDDEIDLQHDENDAEKQILVMSETIDLLRRHLENQRKELQNAYKTIHEYEEKKNKQHTITMENKTTNTNYEKIIRDLNFNLELKQITLNEKTIENEQINIELNKYKNLTKELNEKLERLSNVQNMYQISLNQPSITSTNQSSLSYVPKCERFDRSISNEPYNSTDFWKHQWKDAIKVRKTTTVRPGQHALDPSKIPSMKIFSTPPHGKRGIEMNSISMIENRIGYTDRDERLPAHRYIGLSSRQSQLVKECYKVVGN